MKKIAILGTGSFASALGYQLSRNINNEITFFGRDSQQVNEINTQRSNSRYSYAEFPLNVRATTDYKQLLECEIIFLAIPSKGIIALKGQLQQYVPKKSIVINMAKGLAPHGDTLVDFIKGTISAQAILTLKGPSFSSELLRNVPTAMTLGYHSFEQTTIIDELFEHTSIYIDYTKDINGVEYLSALKNIYAIFMGNIDAKFNSYNTRYFALYQSFKEIKTLLKYLGCDSETIEMSCGIGDLCLTSLSDLSRNRTLGLMIGKGFFNKAVLKENAVVLEGMRTLELLYQTLHQEVIDSQPILNCLIKFFITNESDALDYKFQEQLKKKGKTVITYGTFDLLHYGHLELLKKAKSLGDYLIVGLSTDEFNEEKGKTCAFGYEKRKQYLESLKFVDKVIPEENWEQKEADIKKYNADNFVMGGDWEGKFDNLREFCKVIYLPRTKGISTTQLKSLIKD